MDSYTILEFKGPELPEQYINCVVKKFKNNLRYSNEYFRLIDKAAFNSAYERYIHNIINQHNCSIRLAVLSDDHDVVLGFAVLQPKTVHYVFVDKDQRRLGIGKNLIKESFDTFTHITKVGMLLWPAKFPQAKFNPFKEIA